VDNKQQDDLLAKAARATTAAPPNVIDLANPVAVAMRRFQAALMADGNPVGCVLIGLDGGGRIQATMEMQGGPLQGLGVLDIARMMIVQQFMTGGRKPDGT